MNFLKKEIQALGIDPELQREFIEFAVNQAHAEPNKFKARIYHIINGRTPTAYIALLLVDFFQNHKYEKLIRKTIDHVEYITVDGQTDKLEKFVNSHPLHLRILKVKYEKNNDSLNVVLRTPIKIHNLENLDEDTITRHFNEHVFSFTEWLKMQGELPDKIDLGLEKQVKIEYQSEATETKCFDEWDFSERSNAAGTLKINDGINLMLLCAYKYKAPCIHRDLLDLYYSITSAFGRDFNKKSLQKYSASNLLKGLTMNVDCLPLIFFQEPQHFPEGITSVLNNFFETFLKQHKKLAARVQDDWTEIERQGESYEATPEVFRLYEAARQDYTDSLLPLIKTNKKAILSSIISVTEIYHKRAMEHFEKLKDLFKNEGA